MNITRFVFIYYLNNSQSAKLFNLMKKVLLKDIFDPFILQTCCYYQENQSIYQHKVFNYFHYLPISLVFVGIYAKGVVSVLLAFKNNYNQIWP